MKTALVRAGIFGALGALLGDSAYPYDEMPAPGRTLFDVALFSSAGFFIYLAVERVVRGWPVQRWQSFKRAEAVLALLAIASEIVLLIGHPDPTGVEIRWARTYVFLSLCMVLVQYLGRRLSASKNPAKEFVTTFFGMIVLGSVLLSFPRSGGAVMRFDWLEALFTATSATCVTGLTVVPDVGRDFSRFGQGVILVLMQIGGLGLMTFAAFVAIAMGRGLALKERATIRGALNLHPTGGVGKTVGRILLLTVVVEGVSCLVLWSVFRDHSPGRTGEAAFFFALFHAVSAFCNAGFGLEPTSLAPFAQTTPLVLFVVMAEIIIGGLGFLVVFDVLRRLSPLRRRSGMDDDGDPPVAPVRLTLQSKIVLIVTAVLLVLGIGFYLVSEWSNPATLGGMSTSQKMLAATFQSVTTRTAGFSTIDQSALRPPSLLWTTMMMLIGASPGSTGGGLKTVTLFVVLALIWSTFHHRDRTQTFGRALPREITDRALVVVTGFVGLVLVGTLVLVICDWDTPRQIGLDDPFLPLLFEVASALGTTGLSTGITPDLSTPSKLILIVIMFVGRMGPLTLVLAMRVSPTRKADFEYPEERVLIG